MKPLTDENELDELETYQLRQLDDWEVKELRTYLIRAVATIRALKSQLDEMAEAAIRLANALWEVGATHLLTNYDDYVALAESTRARLEKLMEGSDD